MENKIALYRRISVCMVASVAACVLMATTANAATLTCAGQIKQLHFHAGQGNGFMLQLDSMNVSVFFCDRTTWTVSGAAYTTPPEQCRALVVHSFRRVSRQSLAIVYFDGDSVPATCMDGYWQTNRYFYGLINVNIACEQYRHRYFQFWRWYCSESMEKVYFGENFNLD
jgi:hypothetical protein